VKIGSYMDSFIDLYLLFRRIAHRINATETNGGNQPVLSNYNMRYV
jgi:hypothetical protein